MVGVAKPHWQRGGLKGVLNSRSTICTQCRGQEYTTYRAQGSGVHSSGVCYMHRAGCRSGEFRNVLHTEWRVQESTTYRVQVSWLCYVQSEEFRSVLGPECRVQECAACRVQSLGVCYLQNVGFRTAEFRSVLSTECRVQECAKYRVQDSRKSSAQNAEIQECIIHRAQGSEVHCIQSAGFRNVLCAELRPFYNQKWLPPFTPNFPSPSVQCSPPTPKSHPPLTVSDKKLLLQKSSYSLPQ